MSRKTWSLAVSLLLMTTTLAACEGTFTVGDDFFVQGDSVADSASDLDDDGLVQDSSVDGTSPLDLTPPNDIALDTTSQGDTLDTAPPNDTTDTNPPDPCQGVTCSGHGTCVSGTCACDSGYQPQGGTCVQVDPCQNVTCWPSSTCTAGSCICNAGLIDVGGECRAPDPTDPAQRTTTQVCERWNNDFPTRATTIYDEGGGLAACDPGTIEPTAHDDAMRRLNLYRWLLGLDPSGVSWSNQAMAQAAALNMDANNRLDHFPAASSTCYSADAATGAGSSNLSLGRYHPADTVDDYIEDSYSADLGHRRWCFNPSLDQVGFGHHGRGGAMSCFGSASHAEPDFVAYPGPGPFPVQALHGNWSFHRRNAFSNPVVTITQVSNGAVVPNVTTIRGSNYGWLSTLAIEVSGITVGESYQVVIVDGANQWTYTTHIISC